MMRFAPLVLLATIAAPAAAHDMTLAYVDAMETHLLDCPSVNGFVPDGDLLSTGWAVRDGDNDALTRRAAVFKAKDRVIDSNINVFTKTVEELELIQFMAVRNIEAEEGEPARYVEGEGNIAATEFLCVTMVPELPFMPSGKMLGAVFGKEVDAGIGNSPGDHRNGTWIWDDISPTHVRTIARYTNFFSTTSDLPEDVFYPGFYMLSYRRFTPENSPVASPEIPSEESEQE